LGHVAELRGEIFEGIDRSGVWGDEHAGGGSELAAEGKLALDVGGTTAKISVLRNTIPVQAKPSDFFGIPVEISLPYLRSIALGGGSVVKPGVNGRKPEISLGPESMGSFPGPACYGLGGEQPTLTDALVAAGLINPDYFLGGAKPISLDAARQTIQNFVATPLGKTVEDARQIYEVRSALEGLAGALFAARATDAQRQALVAQMRKLEDAFASGDRRRIRQQTSRYYDVLLEGSGNKFVGDMIRGLQARVTFLRSTSMSHPDRAPASLAEMQRITKAIQKRDPKATEAACRAHIEAARDAALAMLVKGMPS